MQERPESAALHAEGQIGEDLRQQEDRPEPDGSGTSGISLVEAVVFVVYLVCGLLVVPQIPGSWDELGNRKYGEIGSELTRSYLATGEPAEQEFLNEHGTALEVLLMGVERLVGADLETDPAAAMWVRHIAIFLLHSIGVLFFYLLARELFDSRSLGLLAAIFLALHPRIFHDAFHNSCDIGFMSFFIFWAWSLLQLVRKQNPTWVLVHGAVCGFFMAIRIVAAFYVGLTVLILAISVLAPARWLDRRVSVRRTAWSTVGAVVASCGFLVLFWPFLWGRPVGNFLWAVAEVSRLDVPFELRYLGELIWSTEVPWHFNLVWFLVTTPLYITVGAVVGVVAALVAAVRDPKRVLAKQGMPLAIALSFAIPLVAPMLLGSTLFNGWRHHFFVYPAGVLIATYGLGRIMRRVARSTSTPGRLRVEYLTIAAVALHLTWVLVGWHPYQNLYFSHAATWFGEQRGSHHQFEVDYWGTSYREGLEHLAETYDGTLYVAGHWKPLWRNRLWLSPEDRARVVIVRDLREADFFLGIFRQTPPQGYPPHFGREVYAVWIDDIQVLSVRALRPVTGAERVVRSALPEDVQEVLQLYERVWNGGPTRQD